MSVTASAAAGKLWDAYSLLAPEYRRVKILAMWTNESQVLMTRKKAICAVADIKDMKFRVPSKTQGNSIKALGGVPVFMPINRVYNALNTGVIDGILTGPSTIKSFKFDEVAKYFTIGLPLGRSPFFLVMNKNSWNNLSAEHKALVDKTTGRDISIKASKFYMKAGNGGINKVRKSAKHEVIEMTGAELQKARAILNESRTKQIAELEKNGIPARKIMKAMGVTGD